MKLSEAAAFALFDEYSIVRPRFLVVQRRLQGNSVLDTGISTDRFVVKANVAASGKKKSGLVKVAQRGELESAIKDIFFKATKEFLIDSVIVEEYIEHKKEYFLALRVVREGVMLYLSTQGGVDVERDWSKVSNILIPTSSLTNVASLKRSLESCYIEVEKVFGKSQPIEEFIRLVVQFFQQEDAIYLEINPFTLAKEMYVTGNDRGNKHTCMPLGVVLELDDSAGFRHPDWPTTDYRPASPAGGLLTTAREQKIKEIDAQIKGSVKLVEVPGGGNTTLLAGGAGLAYAKASDGQGSELTAVMAAGAGAALFLCDAVIKVGLKLANYAEFSGNPPGFAITELTKQVCSIPGIKNLVIGSGIANFTPVVPNVQAIIEGLRAGRQAKHLNIVVRRCGPGEEEGIKLMREFAKKEGYKIQVFGRETGMTEIIKKLKVQG